MNDELFPPECLLDMGKVMSAKVVGIDTDSSGYFWVSSFPFDSAGARHGWVRCRQKNSNERIPQFTRQAFDMFRCLPGGSHVFCEEPLALPRNGATTRKLGLAAGAIYAAFCLAIPDATWHWVDVAHWKKEVVGNGNANKDRIREFCRENPMWHSHVDPVTDADYEKHRDLYDAWCLKTYGVRQVSA